jgi:nitrite reductase/ring-hydroxylating ferredoxin subunit
MTPRNGNAIARSLDGIADKIERNAALDVLAARVARTVDRLLPNGTARDIASGVPLGHPLHPLLVAVPIGSWSAATWLDLSGGDAATARRLVGLGIISGLPAAITGANDWLTPSGGERRVGLVHARITTSRSRSTVPAGSPGGEGVAAWVQSPRRPDLSLSAPRAGYLADGLGVDTAAFQKLPTDWTDVAAKSDISPNRAVLADADGVPVLLTRHRGSVVALADRCTHRGAPLHEGKLADGCITCPWHGSQFALDGTVRRGPATRPKPVLEVRILGGRVQVRRGDEPRTLRTNPVGV